MKIKEVMSKQSVQFCSPETRLHSAAQLMKVSNVGALPVLEGKKVVGIVTDRDICLSLADEPTSRPSQVKIGDIMTKKVATVSTTDEVREALRQMRTKKIGRLPVVDAEGTLQGVVSLHQVLAKTASAKKDLAGLTEDGEEILKTVKAVTGRYTGAKGKKAGLPEKVEATDWDEAV